MVEILLLLYTTEVCLITSTGEKLKIPERYTCLTDRKHFGMNAELAGLQLSLPCKPYIVIKLAVTV